MPAWLVIDLEATTDEGGWPLEEMEIIEIGAVLVTCGGEEISQWQHFVRPIRHPQLTDFCRQLTQIEQYQLNNAAGFAQASQALDEWLASQTRTVLGWCTTIAASGICKLPRSMRKAAYCICRTTI